LGRAIKLGRIEKEEGLQLLLPEGIDAEELFAAEQILALLGYLPLAIDQARAYISRRRLPLVDFLNDYERRNERVMKETPEFWEYRGTLPDTEKEIPLSLFTTWEMSLPLLGVQEGHVAELAEMLTLFAFFSPVAISEKLFSVNDGDTDFTTSPASIFYHDGQWSHDQFEDAVMQMQELSLLQFLRRNGDEIVVSLHPMISAWLYMRLTKDRQFTFFATAALHLESYLDSTDAYDHSSRQEALPHIDNI
jgi:hypothetical protein